MKVQWQVTAATLGAAGEVISFGVETVLLYTLPSLGFFPSSQVLEPEDLAAADQAVDGLNALLRGGGALLELISGANVEIVEFGAIAEEIAADPTTFGLTAAFDASLYFGAGTPTLDPSVSPFPFYEENPSVADRPFDQIGFIDLLHPTAATHGVLGAFVAASLTSNLRLLGDGDRIGFGRFSNDLVIAGAGDDRVYLLPGDDIALGGLGDDMIYAGFGQDIVAGGSGNDVINGGVRHDLLAGGEGDDHLRGGAGQDLLIDGMGSDTVHGGLGADSFLFVEPEVFGLPDQGDQDIFMGGRGQDIVFLALSAETAEAVGMEIAAGGCNQSFNAIGLTTMGIEHIVFLEDPDEITDFALSARVDDGVLWGFV